MDSDSSTQSASYRIGWWVLVTIAGISLLNHLSGPFLDFVETDDQTLAILAFAAMNIYALTVLITAYRRAEAWAWWVTWVMVALYAVTILYAPIAGRYYLGGAAAMAFAQLLTLSAFRPFDRVGHEVAAS